MSDEQHKQCREHRRADGPVIRFRAVMWALLTFLIAACGGADNQPPGNASGSIDLPGEGSSRSQEVVRGEALTGRLLFVQQGTIWLWQEREARALLGAGDAWQPAWSPDATRIAYVRRGESYSDIMLASPQGETLRRLTHNDSTHVPHSHDRIYDTIWSFYPAWSPNGSHIIMTTQSAPPSGDPAFEHNLALYRLPATGGTRQPLHVSDEANFGRMVYIPNGSALVYTRTDIYGDSAQQLHYLDLRNDVSNPFPGAPTPSYDPAISHDGRWLAFAARDDAETDIWMLPARPTSAGTTPQRLTSLGMARAPAFSPDGRQLAFLAIPEGEAGFELWIADLSIGATGVLQAGPPRQITKGMHLDADSGLSWAPAAVTGDE